MSNTVFLTDGGFPPYTPRPPDSLLGCDRRHMARSQDIQQYPDEYRDIVQRVGGEAEVIRIPFDNIGEARSLRGHYYAFVGALKTFAAYWEPIAKKERTTEGVKENLDLFMQSKKVQVTIETINRQPNVVFQHRENSWQAQALRRAISVHPLDNDKLPTPAREPQEPVVERDLTPEEAMELVRKTPPSGRRKS